MNEIESRRAIRRKQQIIKRRKQRIRFFSFAALIAIILGCIYIYPHLQKNETKVTNAAPDIFVNDTIYPIPPEPTADLLKAINKPDGVKTCYLTFDDGPTTSVTPQILDTLRRYNVKATFFTVGTLLEANSDMARREFEEGHLIANHSYAHNYSKLYADETSFMNEINSTFNIINKITGNPNYPRIFRFPGGGFDAGSHGAAKQAYKTVLKNNKIRYCDWNALNGDAEGGKPSKQDLVERVKKTSTKEDIVILMHDAAAKSTTADALPEIIEYLQSQGFIFKRLDQAPRI